MFLHGWCINKSYWENQVDAFKSGYTIVTVDLPGFGDSGKNRETWTIEQFGLDVQTIIDQLKLKNVILVGHSMSGGIILEAASNEEVIALIGVDNLNDVGELMDEETKVAINQFFDMLRTNYSEMVEQYAEAYLFQQSTTEAVRSRVINDFVSADSIAAIASIEALFNYSDNEASALAKVRQEVFLINSSTTPTSLQVYDSLGVSCTLLSIDSTGHYPMIEKPQEFNQLLATALKHIAKR